MRKKSKSIFPDDNTIKLIALTKQAEADALPQGLAKRKLQKEANSYRILADAKSWMKGELKPPT